MVEVLYKTDSIMYLAKPSASTQSANPFAVMDSFLSQKDQFTCRLVEEKSEDKIIVEFANAQPYKRLEYFINKKTGYINRMVMLVRSEEMYEQSARPQPTAEPSFSIVEMKFSNYRAKGLDEKDFDLGKYFKKEESGYVTLPPYNSYKIFIGTPNL